MRTTQYIGMIQSANDWIEDNLVVIRDDEHYTEGMFCEKIPLSTYINRDKQIYREIVQTTPWSSGMMIFTCLKRECDNKKFFEWKLDIRVKNSEYDAILGLYYV